MTPMGGDSSFDMSSSGVGSSFSDVNSSYAETPTKPTRSSVVLGGRPLAHDFASINSKLNGASSKSESQGYLAFLNSPVSSKTGSALLSDRSFTLASEEDGAKISKDVSDNADLTLKARQVLMNAASNKPSATTDVSSAATMDTVSSTVKHLNFDNNLLLAT
jgi:hypothetical protein